MEVLYEYMMHGKNRSSQTNIYHQINGAIVGIDFHK